MEGLFPGAPLFSPEAAQSLGLHNAFHIPRTANSPHLRPRSLWRGLGSTFLLFRTTELGGRGAEKDPGLSLAGGRVRVTGVGGCAP